MTKEVGMEEKPTCSPTWHAMDNGSWSTRFYHLELLTYNWESTTLGISQLLVLDYILLYKLIG